MPYYNRDPKRDHNFDNHPCAFVVQDWLGTLGSRRAHRSLASAARSQIWGGGFPKLGAPMVIIMENQMEKTMETKWKLGLYRGLYMG